MLGPVNRGYKNVMHTRSTLGILAAVGLIAALAGAVGAAPTRKKVTCAEFRAEVERSTKAVGMPMVLKAGEWGKTPAPLRVLPPNASFCGGNDTGAAIASPLTGKDLIDYYTPILQKMGCKAPKCEIEAKKTHCSCMVGGGLVRIGTEELSEAYDITFMSFK